MAQTDQAGIFRHGRSYLYKVLIALAGLTVAIWFVYRLSDIFTPLFAALALAYILSPVVNWLQTKSLPPQRKPLTRQQAVLLLFLVMGTTLVLLTVLIVPVLVREVRSSTLAIVGEEANRVIPPERMRAVDGVPQRFARAAADAFTSLAVNLAASGAFALPAAQLAGEAMRDRAGDLAPTAEGKDKAVRLEPGTFIDLVPTPTESGPVWGRFDPGKEPGNPYYRDEDLRPAAGEDKLWPKYFRDDNGNGKYDPGYIELLRRKAADPNSWIGKLIDQVANLADDPAIRERTFDWLRAHAKGILAAAGKAMTGSISTGFSAANTVIYVSINLILLPFYTFFFLLGLNKIRDTLYQYIPRDYRERTIHILERIDRVIAGFFRQRLIICLIIGAVTAVGFFICGLRFGVVLGLVIGLATLVPFLSIVPMIPVTIIAYVEPTSTWGWIVALWLVYALGQILDPILTPLMMGREMELHPITLVVGLFVGSRLMGFMGMLLAIPLTAAFKIVFLEMVLPILKEVAEPPKSAADRGGGGGGEDETDAAETLPAETDKRE